MKEVNIKRLIKDIIKNGVSIVGLGYFSYGVHEYWTTLKEILYHISKKIGPIDIYFEDVYPKVKNINDLIHGTSIVNLAQDYDFQYTYPLKNYLSNNAFDSAEFLDFVYFLKGLNDGGNDINIFGVDIPVEDIQYDQNQIEVLNNKSLFKRYPSLKNESSSHLKFLKKNFKKYDKNKFIAEFINHIFDNRRRFSLFVAHNDLVQNFQLGRYKTAGWYLKKFFGKGYLAVGTATKSGSARFVGRIQPSYQDDNEKVYEQIFFDFKPKSYNIKDRGSLQRVVQNNFKKRDDYYIFKMGGDEESSLYYYISGKFYLDDRKNDYYRNIKDLDYLIYFPNSSPTHNLVYTFEEEGLTPTLFI